MRKVRVNVTCVVNEDDVLRNKMNELLREAGHGGLTMEFVAEAIMNGSIVQELQCGRADVHITNEK